MKKDDIKHPPSATRVDAAYTLAKAGISAIPIFGGPVAEILSAIIAPPLSRRRAEWVQEIAEGLKLLEEKIDGFKLEDLSDNKSFVTTVLHATQAAIRNHQEEKLDALRNAVLNTAIGISIDEDVQFMYLNFVDELTPAHLKLLKFFDDPKGWIEKNHIKFPSWNAWCIGMVIEIIFPELKSRHEFYDQIGKDLHTRGLAERVNFQLTLKFNDFHWYHPANMPRSTTDIGQGFISFITRPKTVE